MRPRRNAPGRRATGRRQAQYLRRLGRVIAAAHGAEAACELRWQENARTSRISWCTVSRCGGATSTGWRFLWNRYRSHSVTDLSGAVDALRPTWACPGVARRRSPALAPGGPPGPGGAQPLA